MPRNWICRFGGVARAGERQRGSHLQGRRDFLRATKRSALGFGQCEQNGAGKAASGFPLRPRSGIEHSRSGRGRERTSLSMSRVATPIFEKLFGGKEKAERYSMLFLRSMLGAAFLNGIASRVGLYGRNVGYGNYTNYVKYAGQVNSFMPTWAIPFLANAATVAELSFGLMLVLGLWVRWAAYGSAGLLAMFGIAMT